MGASFRYWVAVCCIATALAGLATAGRAEQNGQVPPGSLAEYSGSLDQALNDEGIAWTAERDSLIAAALNDWLTWMLPTLIDAYEQYMYMRHLMWPVYAQAGLPEALLFGILAKESGEIGRAHV